MKESLLLYVLLVLKRSVVGCLYPYWSVKSWSYSTLSNESYPLPSIHVNFVLVSIHIEEALLCHYSNSIKIEDIFLFVVVIIIIIVEVIEKL